MRRLGSALYASVLRTLRDRGVVRTGNNPAGDYAELLVCKAFGLEGQRNSNQGFDARCPSTGVPQQDVPVR
jgi:hypothetical protein